MQCDHVWWLHGAYGCTTLRGCDGTGGTQTLRGGVKIVRGDHPCKLHGAKTQDSVPPSYSYSYGHELRYMYPYALHGPSGHHSNLMCNILHHRCTCRGSTRVRSLLSHGSHLFVSNPTLDLLAGTYVRMLRHQTCTYNLKLFVISVLSFYWSISFSHTSFFPVCVVMCA